MLTTPLSFIIKAKNCLYWSWLSLLFRCWDEYKNQQWSAPNRNPDQQSEIRKDWIEIQIDWSQITRSLTSSNAPLTYVSAISIQYTFYFKDMSRTYIHFNIKTKKMDKKMNIKIVNKNQKWWSDRLLLNDSNDWSWELGRSAWYTGANWTPWLLCLEPKWAANPMCHILKQWCAQCARVAITHVPHPKWGVTNQPT